MDEFRRKRKLELDLEDIFVKKCKITSETCSTYSFKEKKIEEYYQHHYHPYTENRIIDFVNDDCLAEIFMYVPICERPKISLVCQQWKRALESTWSNVKKLELTYWKYDEKPTCLQKYETLDGQFNFLKSLLSKCGHYLTLLDLSAYSHCNIVPVVNEHCPNLVELRLRFIFVNNEMLFDAFSRLSKLKILKIIFQELKGKAIPFPLIYSLRNVAATLTDLIWCNWGDEVYEPCRISEIFVYVIRELKALKRFEIAGILISKNLLSHLKDNVPVYAGHGSYFFELKTNQLQEMRSMFLRPEKITDDGLYTIANNLKNLVELRLVWNYLTNVGIVTISKMKLKSLTFDGLNKNIDSSSLKLLKNMIILRLSFNDNITDALAIKLLGNSPNMKQLNVLNKTVTIEFIKKAEEISRKRKQLLILGVIIECDMKKYESSYLEIHLPPKSLIRK